jgi:D-beta-D-heptose 7-phosphate kinase/D-beta-D-heptose 1-phosphate adenosyltransferase
VRDTERPTTLKTRVIAHSQQIVRVDREKSDPSSRKIRDAMLKRIFSLLAKVQGVVLSDYRKGVLSVELVEEIISAARKKGVFVAVDPKQSDFSWYKGCTIITPNKKEAEVALGGKELRSDQEVLDGGKKLLRKTGARAILVTRGEEGMTLVERGRKQCFNVSAIARHVFDVTGAGDTAIGVLSACLAAGASMREAATLANIAAGVVVGEVGTSPISIEKLLHAIRSARRGDSG